MQRQHLGTRVRCVLPSELDRRHRPSPRRTHRSPRDRMLTPARMRKCQARPRECIATRSVPGRLTCLLARPPEVLVAALWGSLSPRCHQARRPARRLRAMPVARARRPGPSVSAGRGSRSAPPGARRHVERGDRRGDPPASDDSTVVVSTLTATSPDHFAAREATSGSPDRGSPALANGECPRGDLNPARGGTSPNGGSITTPS